VPAASHPHVKPGDVVLALVVTAAIAALVGLARPTKPCGRCHGERVAIEKHWLIGHTRTRRAPPLLRTGRVPRVGARTMHRLSW
jgi:hypothetical protein